MFLSVVALALITGALAGGGLPRLADLRLRSVWILGLALALRFAAGLVREGDLLLDVPLGPAFIAAYGLILVWLWRNWKVPGLQIAAVGIALNFLAVVLNSGPDADLVGGLHRGRIHAGRPWLTTHSISS